MLDEKAVCAVREYLLSIVAHQPHVFEVATPLERQRAVDDAMKCNKSALQVDMTGMGQVLRKFAKPRSQQAP